MVRCLGAQSTSTVNKSGQRSDESDRPAIVAAAEHFVQRQLAILQPDASHDWRCRSQLRAITAELLEQNSTRFYLQSHRPCEKHVYGAGQGRRQCSMKSVLVVPYLVDQPTKAKLQVS